jgi:peptidoglycan/LPS O-acetylase OafA/YrhL
MFKFSETASVNLDIIRVGAIQNVAIAHGMAMMHLIPPITPGLFGSISFPLIFLLSGIFTAYSIYHKKKTPEYGFNKYFVNRISRIYPSFLLSLVFLVLFDAFFLFLGGSLEAFDIITLILNLFFLNDSVFNIPNFGSSYNLWTLPNFFWSYLFLGWLMLGTKKRKINYKYFLILGLFAFLLMAVYLGPWYKINLLGDLGLFYIWVCGFLITLIVNKYDSIIKKKTKTNKGWNTQQKFNKLFLYLSLFFFIFGSIGCLLILDIGPYQIEYLMILVCSVFSLIIYSQYTKYRYSQRAKKIIRFMANYTFTLYIVHFSLFNFLTLFIDGFNSPLWHRIIFFFIGYLSSNGLAIIIGYFTEMRSNKINKYLLTKFKMNKD